MRFSTLFALLAILLFSTCAFAEITGFDCAADGDGAIVCQPVTWADTPDGYEMGIVGNQFSGPGHMIGHFTTNDPLDPIVKSLNSFDNYSGFTWTGYNVDVILDQYFTLSNVVSPTPGDWHVSYDQTSTLQSTVIVDGVNVGPKYVAHISYTAGTPVLSGTDPVANDGETLDFNYKISFSGSTSYTLIQQGAPVPEPGILALLACGAVGLLVARRRIAR